MSNNEQGNTERIIDYIRQVNDDKLRLANANTFYAGLIFGMLGIMTLWLMWNIAQWSMGL